MSPIAMRHIIDQVVRDQAGRMALEDRQRGRGDIPASLYIERIAERLGLTKRQLYRYMDGSTSPSVATLLQLCLVCESDLALRWMAREYTAQVRARVRDTSRVDLVGMVSHEMADAAASAKLVLDALADGQITPAEAAQASKILDDTVEALLDLKTAVAQIAARGGTPGPASTTRLHAA